MEQLFNGAGNLILSLTSCCQSMKSMQRDDHYISCPMNMNDEQLHMPDCSVHCMFMCCVTVTTRVARRE